MICPAIPRTREFIIILVYLALFLDNILLTVIVPILPDFLLHQHKNLTIPKSVIYKNFDLHYVPDILTKHHHQRNRNRHHHPHADASSGYSILEKENNYFNLTGEQLRVYKFEEENGSIGILLAIKAFVQLAFNPIVGIATNRFGYRTPVFIGTCCIFVSAIIFAIGEEYAILFFARALQGIGSACIGVCGMSLVAQLYPEEDKRSRIMGIVLGSIALGVLIGYPFGGILYDFFSKSTPFYIIAFILFATIILQFIMLDFTPIPAPETPVTEHSSDIKWWPLLTDHLILLIACAIWISTSAMAILEPCLPIWLLSHLHPKKWQLGTVFIPDSVGYLMGTNFFGSIAYKIGQIKISVMALILVGISCILIPNATSVLGLLLPHFGLGLGIGVLDAALVPLLAAVVDSKCGAEEDSSGDFQYGAVYAIQQTAVSLAYSIAPMIGGELAQSVGFPWLMRIIGFINLTYGLVFIYFTAKLNLQQTRNKSEDILLNDIEVQSNPNYRKFYNSIE